MTGGLMNLVAYGNENLLFNGNPKKTFFKATYQKYTNFGLQRFRIDFEGIAWMDTATTIPETFNPDEFTPVELDDIPTKFNLQSAGNVATSDLYKQVSLSAIEMHENSMEGTLFNYGIQEVTIPQLLVSYYDKDKKLIWVASQFMREGVRIQRKQYFAYEWENLIDVEVLNSSLEIEPS